MSGDLELRDVLVADRLGPLDLVLEAGRLTVLMGANGAGKSTLLSVLAGLIRPDRGRVMCGGTDLGTLRPVERAAHTAWLPQDAPREDGVTVREAAAAARYRHAESASTRRAAAERTLDQLGLGAFVDRPMRTLSGGEAQRVRMAAMAAQEASWWLLDEPANHLDPAVRLDLAAILVDRVRSGGSVALVSHDLGLLPHLGEARVVVLANGRVLHQGPVAAPDVQETLSDAFSVHLHRVEHDEGWALVSGGRR